MLGSEIMRIPIIFLVMISLTSLAVCQDMLAPGETWTYKAGYSVNESDLCSDIVNNATVTAYDPCSREVNSTNGTSVSTDYNADLSIKKISDKAGEVVDTGDLITYTYYVKNTGDVNLSGVSLSDNMVANPRYVSGDGNGDSMLNPGEVWTFEGVYFVHEQDLCHDIVNIASVKAVDPCNKEIMEHATATVKTLCASCCQDGENKDSINVGDQRSVGLHNSQAENKVKIVTSQTI
jgi:uncharacterized repeat protein (TIGR01451 family)